MALRMADSMRSVPWLRSEVWGDSTFCGGRVHLGVVNRQAQPLTTNGSAIRVWFDGEVYPSFTERGTTPTAEEVTELLRDSGARLAKVDGVFSLAYYDPDNRELILANDRLGFRPLYYTETEKWFAYAAEVKALLAILDTRPHLDEISLRQYFSFDYMFGERTWWKGIELIPPASIWRISGDGRRSTRYWRLGDIRYDPQKEEDVVMEFGRLWSHAIHRRCKPGTMPLLLSGGLDSRLVLAELYRQGADLVAITFGDRDSPDMKIAQQCAEIAGVPHRPLYLNVENWWHRREEAIWQTDGLVNAIHLHVAIALDELHTGNCYTLKNSTGDTLFGGSTLRMNHIQDWPNSPNQHLIMRYHKNPFFECDHVVDISAGDCERYMCGPSPVCFALSQGQRRFVLTGPGSMATHCEVVNPGIDVAMLRLTLGSLSDEQRINSRFYKRFLATRYPKFFRNIPWQKTGRGIAESLPTRASRGIRTRMERWIGRRTKSTNFADYNQLVRDSNIVEKLACEDLLADEFLNGAARRGLLDRQSPPMDARVILAVYTFETYLRQVAGMPSLKVPTSRISPFGKHVQGVLV